MESGRFKWLISFLHFASQKVVDKLLLFASQKVKTNFNFFILVRTFGAQTDLSFVDKARPWSLYMEQEHIGTIKSIRGDVVEAEFPGVKPNRFELLEFVEDPAIKLEVYSSNNKDSVFCICFSDPGKLYRGGKLARRFETINVPVGKELLGRVVDLFGHAQDNLGEIKTTQTRSIYAQPPNFASTNIHSFINLS